MKIGALKVINGVVTSCLISVRVRH